MFTFAPNTIIKEHPIPIASGDWTAVSGAIEGTFTLPMDVGGGKTIACGSIDLLAVKDSLTVNAQSTSSSGGGLFGCGSARAPGKASTRLCALMGNIVV